MRRARIFPALAVALCAPSAVLASIGLRSLADERGRRLARYRGGATRLLSDAASA